MRDSITSSPDHPLLPEPTDGVLDQYLAAQLSDAESQQVTKYVEQRPEWRRFLWRIRHWLTEPDVPQAPDEREAFSRFLRVLSVWSHEPAHLADQTSPEYSGRRLGRGPQTFGTARHNAKGFSGRPLRWGMWYVLSGVGVGVALLVAGLKFGSVQLLGGRATSEPAYTTYTTANGQRATITLSDGSTVTLNVASRLDVPVDYTRGDHALRLSGAALFKVLHHDLTPFTVVAGGTTTRVLGTSFVVRSYANDTAVTVAVRDGKVGVGSLVLTAERQVVIGHSGAPRVRVADPAQFSFATGVLTLTGGLLADAIPELDRWYNADIRLGDPGLGSQRIQGNVSAGSLAELAAMLEWTYNVRVVRDGQVLTLFPR